MAAAGERQTRRPASGIVNQAPRLSVEQLICNQKVAAEKAVAGEGAAAASI
jgi:hypothetical protein